MKVQLNPIPVDGALWSALDDLWNAVNDAHGQLDEGELSATAAARQTSEACTAYLAALRRVDTLPPAPQPQEQS